MPVEIKEIIIRAIIEKREDTPSEFGNYEELVQNSAEQVLRIIEKKKER